MTGWTDLPADLSDRAALSRLSAHLPKAPMVSSDLCRARDTAIAIGQGRLLLGEYPDLREIHFGTWEGLAHDAIPDQSHARSFWESPGDIAPPGGESWNQLARRVSACIASLQETDRRDIIVVCHFGPILTQIQQVRGMSATEAFGQKIDPLSVTRITYGRTRILHEINHCP
jgi:broad specificity phosphatase PhoE